MIRCKVLSKAGGNQESMVLDTQAAETSTA